MKKIIFSRESQTNLYKLYDYLKTHFDSEFAKNTVNLVLEKIGNLKKFPYLGKTSEISGLVRELIVEGNAIYYQITDDSIEILYIKIRRTKE